MRSCNDCMHVEVCKDYAISYLKTDGSTPMETLEKEVGDYPCCRFKDSSQFMELPIIDDYEEAKLLDIAIDYCYKVAMSSDPDICAEYKAEHMRLCGWLGDLRRRIEAEQALKGCETNAECG